jgi:periplasmic protein TonB
MLCCDSRKEDVMLLDSGCVTTDESRGEGYAAGEPVLAIARLAPMTAAQAPEMVAVGRYCEKHGARFSAVAMTIAVHLLLLVALAGLGHQYVKKQEAALTVVNLSVPIPPPVATPPEPEKRQIATERPGIQTPAPLPPVVVPMSDTVPPLAVAPQSAPASAPVAPPAPPIIAAPPDLAARMVSGQPPRYPIESRRAREQGTVELMILLGLDGEVETISVARSSGFSRLDRAALQAVRRWRWAPLIRNGEAVKVRGVVEIPFVLQNVG